MSKTLVISDNEILNTMYAMNLEVYLATSVEVVNSAQIALEILEKEKSFDLIISLSSIAKEDTAQQIHQFLNERNLTPHMVVVGSLEKPLSNVEVVASSYHIQNLLRVCAKLLGVTAKSMAALEVPEFFPVEIDYFKRLLKAPCQIYLKDKKGDDSFTIVAKRGESFSDLVKNLITSGEHTLYVNRFERLILINHISTGLSELIMNSTNLDVNERSNALEAGFEFVANDFCQSPEAAQEVMALANACTAAMEDVTKSLPSLKSMLKMLQKNKSGYLYTHTMLASYVANHIVKNISWGGESQVEKINFVLFFHDIVLAPIYNKYPELKFEEELIFSDILNESEKETILNHARLAAELMLSYKKAPIGVDLLIKQHHGMTNGIGFALEFKDDISPLSKVVLIAEHFVDEYLRTKEKNMDAVLDLKKLLPAMDEKFKKVSYKKIIKTLETLRL